MTGSDEEQRWNTYLWHADSGQLMLANLWGVRNEDELRTREYAHTTKRAIELELGKVQIPRTTDMAEWQAIHRHLFADVYSWAGEPRTVRLWKGGQEFLRPDDFPRFLPEVFDRARHADWASMQRLQFVSAAAHLFMDLNWAHPFREGNGRTTKIFLNRIIEPASWRLDFALIDRATWIEASASAGPMHYHRPTNPARLLHAFSQIAVARETSPGTARKTSAPTHAVTVTQGPATGSSIAAAIHAAGVAEPASAESGSESSARTAALAQTERGSGPSL